LQQVFQDSQLSAMCQWAHHGFQGVAALARHYLFAVGL
jgi:hypothetical protein